MIHGGCQWGGFQNITTAVLWALNVLEWYRA